jgi:hypothetical protein
MRLRLVEEPLEEELEPIDKRVWTSQEGQNAVFRIRFESGRVLCKCRTQASSSHFVPERPSSFMSTSPYDGSMFSSKLGETGHADYESDVVEYLHKIMEYSSRVARRLDDRLVGFCITCRALCWLGAVGSEPVPCGYVAG